MLLRVNRGRFLLVLSERLGNTGCEILPSLCLLVSCIKRRLQLCCTHFVCSIIISSVSLPSLEQGRRYEESLKAICLLSCLCAASHYFRFTYRVLCPFKPLSIILAAIEPFPGQRGALSWSIFFVTGIEQFVLSIFQITLRKCVVRNTALRELT
jgi:hypothetical protein